MVQFTGSKLHCIRGERFVFSSLDFKIESGQALVLQGANGSGKSSLLRLMAGLLKPESGSLLWDGEQTDEGADVHSARLHYLGHGNAVKPALSVRENLNFWAGLIIAKERKVQDGFGVETALKRFEIAHLADLPARFLSAGQCRRLALARLLDEPANALDARSTEVLADLIGEHRAQGGMVALATHARDVPADMQSLELGDYAVDQIQ
jgi:heme exporter protein A